MKVKIAAVTTAGIFLIVCASLSIYRGRTASTVHAAPAARPGAGGMQSDGDSPINIGGGSIYGFLKPPATGWTIVSQNEVDAVGNNIGVIRTTDVSGITSPVNVPSGWVIRISNRKKADKSENPNAVKICSDIHCTGKSLDPTKAIYIHARKNSRWSISSPDGYLHFHDNDCDGATGSAENQPCDYLFKVRIQSPNGHDVASGECTNGHCNIGIGTP